MSKSNLIHSDFIRITDTTVANASVNESIQEMIDDIPNQSLQVPIVLQN